MSFDDTVFVRFISSPQVIRVQMSKMCNEKLVRDRCEQSLVKEFRAKARTTSKRSVRQKKKKPK